jgi:hypothetical protein
MGVTCPGKGKDHDLARLPTFCRAIHFSIEQLDVLSKESKYDELEENSWFYRCELRIWANRH